MSKGGKKKKKEEAKKKRRKKKKKEKVWLTHGRSSLTHSFTHSLTRNSPPLPLVTLPLYHS